MSSFLTSVVSALAANNASTLNQAASVYLISEKEKLQFPVPPKDFSVSVRQNNGAININNLGELNMIGKSGLKQVSIKSFFPAQQYSFCVCSADKPYNYIKKIEEMRTSGKPLRITISDTPVDWPCLIEEFKYGEDDGTSDVSWSLELKEYIYVGGVEDKTLNQNTGLKERPDTFADKLKNITVYPGDSVMDIAVRAAGDNYQTAYKAFVKSGGLNAGDVVTVTKNIIKVDGKNVYL